MVPARGLAALAGLLSLLTLLLTVLPYLVIDPGAVGVYYAVGPVGPPIVALFAIIAEIGLLAGAYDRTNPATAAGVAVAFSAIGSVIALWWTLAVTPAIVGSLSTMTILQHHRWALLLVTVGLTGVSGWYARSVL